MTDFCRTALMMSQVTLTARKFVARTTNDYCHLGSPSYSPTDSQHHFLSYFSVGGKKKSTTTRGWVGLWGRGGSSVLQTVLFAA